MLVGYARVSTHQQDTAAQLDALRRSGVTRVFQEKASSVGARPQLQRCLRSLGQGDVLVVYRLDRVARSLADLLSILDRIASAGAAIRSLTEPLDTSTSMGVFVLQILGAVAQLERSMIRERTLAGQLLAYERGTKFGRPTACGPRDVAAMQRLRAKGLSYGAIGDRLGFSVHTVRYHLVDKPARAVAPVLSSLRAK